MPTSIEAFHEDGFVFIDAASRPFLVQPVEDHWWIFYWHPGKTWVSLRRLREAEVIDFMARRIPRDQAELYFSRPGGGKE